MSSTNKLFGRFSGEDRLLLSPDKDLFCPGKLLIVVSEAKAKTQNLLGKMSGRMDGSK